MSTRAVRNPKCTHGSVLGQTVSSTPFSADASGCPVKTATPISTNGNGCPVKTAINQVSQTLTLLQPSYLKFGLLLYSMMTPSNGCVFRVTVPFWGESTGQQWIPLKMPVKLSFDVFFDQGSTNGWSSNRDAGDLKRYRVHYDVSVMHYIPWNMTKGWFCCGYVV